MLQMLKIPKPFKPFLLSHGHGERHGQDGLRAFVWWSPKVVGRARPFCGPRGCVHRSVDDLDRRGGRFMLVVLAFHVFMNYTTMLICFWDITSQPQCQEIVQILLTKYLIITYLWIFLSRFFKVVTRCSIVALTPIAHCKTSLNM